MTDDEIDLEEFAEILAAQLEQDTQLYDALDRMADSDLWDSHTGMLEGGQTQVRDLHNHLRELVANAPFDLPDGHEIDDWHPQFDQEERYEYSQLYEHSL